MDKTKLLNNFDEEFYFTITTLKKERTGLPVHIFIDDFGVKRNILKNLPKILIQPNKNDFNKLVFVTISDKPQVLNPNNTLIQLTENELKTIFDFVKINKDILLLSWKNEIDVIDLTDVLYKRGLLKR